MKIVVCFKGVPAAKHVALDPVTHNLQREHTTSEMDPDDRYGMRIALQLRQALPSTTIVALTMGAPHSQIVLQQALAMGADQAILLSDRAFAGADTLATSYTLAQAIRKIANVDLVITGYSSHDADTGQVGPDLAAQLHWQQATNVTALTYHDLMWQITQQRNNTLQQLQTDEHLVVTVQRQTTLKPAQMSMTGIHKAVQTPITIWNTTVLHCDLQRVGQAGSATRVTKLITPELPMHHAQTLHTATDFLQIIKKNKGK